jgi:hypothetical protein
MTEAICELAAHPKLNLLHRYETRLHTMFQRGLHNLLLRRHAEMPNEPGNLLNLEENPETEHLPPGPSSLPALTSAPRLSRSATARK